MNVNMVVAEELERVDVTEWCWMKAMVVIGRMEVCMFRIEYHYIVIETVPHPASEMCSKISRLIHTTMYH